MVFYTTASRRHLDGNLTATRRRLSGKDNSVPVEDLLNKNPSLVALGKNKLTETVWEVERKPVERTNPRATPGPERPRLGLGPERPRLRLGPELDCKRDGSLPKSQFSLGK